MMQIVRVQADLKFDGKSKPVSAGFRPTLLIGDKKALCNIDFLEPMPLPPHEHGKAVITLAWDWPQPCPVRIGMQFSTLEGETVVGQGNVTELL